MIEFDKDEISSYKGVWGRLSNGRLVPLDTEALKFAWEKGFIEKKWAVLQEDVARRPMTVEWRERMNNMHGRRG